MQLTRAGFVLSETSQNVESSPEFSILGIAYRVSPICESPSLVSNHSAKRLSCTSGLQNTPGSPCCGYSPHFRSLLRLRGPCVQQTYSKCSSLHYPTGLMPRPSHHPQYRKLQSRIHFLIFNAQSGKGWRKLTPSPRTDQSSIRSQAIFQSPPAARPFPLRPIPATLRSSPCL